ncbi:hypothetical protein RHMOL_Rhmol09G0097700 [Rhododendron molle]|uniref:Uncharacterized protein n=1 Tax=Rhododendron molle TaxID=49168 RepID=A0ACC0MBP4_RHOML|nr:hypothetical protein RHMOL_Rhmol09G0097700 [Rhododendron molle]
MTTKENDLMRPSMASCWGEKFSQLGWIILRGELYHSGTNFLASVSDFAENQEEPQNPEGEQFYAEENPEVGVEPQYAWDPYQS